ncbi:MAG: hypothetical protein AB7S57_10320 [Acetobacteraceae bacterium]
MSELQDFGAYYNTTRGMRDHHDSAAAAFISLSSPNPQALDQCWTSGTDGSVLVVPVAHAASLGM